MPLIAFCSQNLAFRSNTLVTGRSKHASGLCRHDDVVDWSKLHVIAGLISKHWLRIETCRSRLLSGACFEPDVVDSFGAIEHRAHGAVMDVGISTDERSILEKEAIDNSEFDEEEFEDVELEKAAATSTGVDEGVAIPEEQKKRWIRTSSVSRKGKKAIATCMLTIVVALVAGLLIGFKLRDSGSNNPLELFLGEICSTTL